MWALNGDLYWPCVQNNYQTPHLIGANPLGLSHRRARRAFQAIRHCIDADTTDAKQPLVCYQTAKVPFGKRDIVGTQQLHTAVMTGECRYHLHTRNVPAAAAALLKLLAAWAAGVGAAFGAWWEAAVAVPLRRLFPFLDAQHRLAQLRTVRGGFIWAPRCLEN